jgi:allophanate hydrolase/aspartyl-tRNA(Asn)/glutamyl-tRNA(Gln) amidotransferase subunit A
VAAGLVTLALGTDTGGSGRVPAAFNNVVGLKPTRGQISGVGTVPACRSIETISIFALTVADAWAGFEVVQAFDPEDPFARRDPLTPARFTDGPFRFGVPAPGGFDFFSPGAAALFASAVRRLEAIGGHAREIDYGPFAAINELLFQGPWLAERYGALSRFATTRPESLWPVTRDILLGGARVTGADVFAGQERLQRLKRGLEELWRDIDALVVPTTGGIPSLAEVEADPIGVNARIGTYTNFVNLADLAAVAVPSGFLPSGLPQGISIVTPAFTDRDAAAIATRFLAAGSHSPGVRGAAA